MQLSCAVVMVFGVRRQSEAATALWIGLIDGATLKSKAVSRYGLPPHSKFLSHAKLEFPFFFRHLVRNEG
jgi:hypothetical protein